MAQGFLQRPGVNYGETYSPIMGTITCQYLISLSTYNKLNMHLMDVVTTYLYSLLDNDIYTKIPGELKVSTSSSSQGIFSIKLQRSLYGLKQSRWMQYNCLNKYLIRKGFKNDIVYPCAYIKKFTTRFIIIAMYIDG